MMKQNIYSFKTRRWFYVISATMIKYLKKNYLHKFGRIVSQRNTILYHFFAKKPAIILRNLLSFSMLHQLFLIFLSNHLVFCKDPKQTFEMSYGRITSVIWQYYELNVFMTTEQISNMLSDQKLLIIYFEFNKKSELVISMRAK